MMKPIDDVRIREIKELSPPEQVLREIPASEEMAASVFAARQAIHRILVGADERMLVVIGPCSIHDPRSAIEYAKRLKAEAARVSANLLVVMRVYFEKPRTTVGWKGLINDPHLDGSFAINEGLRLARRLLAALTMLGVPCATEFLDTITPQYTADLIAWGAIGARTTESQVHRELASGLSSPVGFKNGTDGNVRIAVDAIRAATSPHHFLSVTKSGRSAIVSTNGNEDCHLILRGGKAPNYDAASVESACKELGQAGLAARVMIDCSHANARKQHKLQMDVARDVGAQVAGGDDRIVALMVESNLQEGRQDLVPGKPLEYGRSITDPCLGWDDSIALLDRLADAVEPRRVVLADRRAAAPSSSGACRGNERRRLRRLPDARCGVPVLDAAQQPARGASNAHRTSRPHHGAPGSCRCAVRHGMRRRRLHSLEPGHRERDHPARAGRERLRLYRRERLAGIALVESTRRDAELRHHRARSRRADRERVLALGRVRHSGLRDLVAEECGQPE